MLYFRGLCLYMLSLVIILINFIQFYLLSLTLVSFYRYVGMFFPNSSFAIVIFCALVQFWKFFNISILASYFCTGCGLGCIHCIVILFAYFSQHCSQTIFYEIWWEGLKYEFSNLSIHHHLNYVFTSSLIIVFSRK